MTPRQEFLVLETFGDVAVYAPRQFVHGTPVGRDAQRLGIDGPSRVEPPQIHFTKAEFDQWRHRLEETGYTVTIGPFWRGPDLWEMSAEAIAQRRTVPLKEAFDELLNGVDRERQAKDQRMEAVESHDS